jgi:hypothetical protein
MLRLRSRKLATKQGLGKGCASRLCTNVRIEIAFDSNQGNRTLASKFRCHHNTVRNSRLLAGCSTLWIQLGWSQTIEKFCQTHKPACAVLRRQWDETRHKLKVATVPGCLSAGSLGERHEQTWEICVSDMRLIISWPPQSCIPTVLIDLIVPPLPVLTPSAANLYAALYDHPCARGLTDFAYALFFS